MTSAPGRPVIFISYSRGDEPEQPRDGEIQWRTYVQSFLRPVARNSNSEVWTDRDIETDADWENNIREKLADCDVCVLLVSCHSLASDFVINIEVETIR